ncbi:MAG: GGDEF domain-containing protein [Bacillota bacterium]
MDSVQRMVEQFGGDDVKMRRLVMYWGATVLLYLLSLSILWVEVYSGNAARRPVLWLTALAIAGHLLFYGLIRLSKYLHLTPAQLSVYQGRFAIFCTVAGYAMMGPLRGASLVILLVILVFCAFTLEAKKTHSLSVFAILLLAGAMILMKYAVPHLFNPKTELIHFILSGSMLLSVAFLTGRLSELRARMKAQRAELIEALAHIQLLAERDELTSLPNRRYMSGLLGQEECRRKTERFAGCLAMLDLDWFKKINDAHGHAAGDDVLRRFSAESRQCLRSGDVLARWGGEEFLLYLRDTRLEAAQAVIERLRERVASLRFDCGGARFGVTFSAGLVELLPDEPMDIGIRRADALLYRAKEEGRNRVIAELAITIAA